MSKTTMVANTFCADIFLPNAAGYSELHGVRCNGVMTGCAADTAEQSIARAVEVASDPRGYGDRPIVYVVAVECCGRCGGTGRVQKMRRGRRVPFGFLDCPQCKTAGNWQTGRVVTVVNGGAS